jgi:dienelactone hydrolase
LRQWGRAQAYAPGICQHFAQRSIDAGTTLTVTLYPSAMHDFDDPGEKRQEVPGNVEAKADAMPRAAAEGMSKP